MTSETRRDSYRPLRDSYRPSSRPSQSAVDQRYEHEDPFRRQGSDETEVELLSDHNEPFPAQGGTKTRRGKGDHMDSYIWDLPKNKRALKVPVHHGRTVLVATNILIAKLYTGKDSPSALCADIPNPWLTSDPRMLQAKMKASWQDAVEVLKNNSDPFPDNASARQVGALEQYPH